MKNLKVSMKLIVSFGIVIVLSVIIGVCGIFGMNSINNSCNNMYDHNFLPVASIGKVDSNTYELRMIARDFVIQTEAGKLKEASDQWNSIKTELDQNMKDYEATVNSDEERVMLTDLKRTVSDWLADSEKIRELGMANKEVEAEAQLAGNGVLAAKVTDAVDKIYNFNVSQGGQASIDTDEQYAMLATVTIAALIIGVIIAVLLTVYISGLISKPLNALSNFLKRAAATGNIVFTSQEKEAIDRYGKLRDEIGQCIANCSHFINHVSNIAKELEVIAGGDLSDEIKTLSGEDTMGVSLMKMLGRLNEMFGEITNAASQVSSGSKQIADGAQSLAQGSTEQAASIEELSSSISEIADRTKTNAETADKTAKLSTVIRESAEKGSRQMDEMIAAVKDINDAGHSIEKIIKTIDDIAFQTNILALNAAVEAARAGQHGKGFAVVAEEVRNLASKSAEAAKETGNLIADSVEKAALGSRIAEETSTSLVEIVSGINESSLLISEIASASEQQSAGITQINIGIDQVAQVVQQNSATAEESAAASEEMSGQSDMLQQLITQFKLKSDTSGRRLPSGGAKPAPRQLVMPEKNNYAAGGNDFGKY